ncbi:hypothetical protein MKW98_011927 [Papaver atlanticum]|uniref:ATPase AAA-type core domain-containing protein n=1 Tax=Papaver atlanticum TaxID=357466 RepID=A0AAD4XP26_9MAGN|nr:hypothetical protein MKW98_011927 [Papaver atlanticum]
MRKWSGDAQKPVAVVFTLVHKLQPAIIFIDEVDGFLEQRRATDHEALTNMKTKFMALWDGFTTDHDSMQDCHPEATLIDLALRLRAWYNKYLDQVLMRKGEAESQDDK